MTTTIWAHSLQRTAKSMLREVNIPAEDRPYTPSDFATDAARILDLLAKDWEHVACMPYIVRNEGRKPDYQGPLWRFRRPMGKGAGTIMSDVTFGIPFDYIHDVAVEDPHLNHFHALLSGYGDSLQYTPEMAKSSYGKGKLHEIKDTLDCERGLYT